MSTKYTIKDTTQDLAFLLSLTNLFAADDKGFWVDTGTEERFKYAFEGNSDGKEIVLFQDPMPKGDFYYFNPFAEGFGRKSPAVNLFYKTIRVNLNVNIRKVVLHVLEELLLSKEDKDHQLTPAVLRMSSVPLDKKHTLFDVVDEKMLDEFTKILDRLEVTETNGPVYVVYLTPQMTARVKCDVLTDDKWEDKFGKEIRKKSIQAFRCLIMGVLGIKTPEDLDTFTEKYDPSLKSSARLHTTMSVYLSLYSKFNDILPEGHEIDLGSLTEVIDRFPLAYAIAKHMIQPTVPTKSAVDITTSDTSKMVINPLAQKRFLQPEVVDNFGRRIDQVASQPVFTPSNQVNKFKPHIVDNGPSDPFSPIPGGIAQPAQSPFNQPVQQMYGQVGSYFGGSGMTTMNNGLTLNPPSNFGSPGTRRGYFG
jgi:hypothetical protein